MCKKTTISLAPVFSKGFSLLIKWYTEVEPIYILNPHDTYERTMNARAGATPRGTAPTLQILGVFLGVWHRDG